MSAGRGRGGLLLGNANSSPTINQQQPTSVSSVAGIGRGNVISSAPVVISTIANNSSNNSAGRGSSLLSGGNIPTTTTTTSSSTPIVSAGRGGLMRTNNSGPVITVKSETSTIPPTTSDNNSTTTTPSSSSNNNNNTTPLSAGRGSKISNSTQPPSDVKSTPKVQQSISSSEEEVSSDEEYLRSVSSNKKKNMRKSNKTDLDNNDSDLSEDEREIIKKLSQSSLSDSSNQKNQETGQAVASAFGRCLTTSLTNESFVKSFFANSPERLSPYYEILHNKKHVNNSNTNSSPIIDFFKFDTPSPDDLISSARSQQKASHKPLEDFKPIEKKQTPQKNKSKNTTILDMDIDESEKKEPQSPKPIKSSGIKHKAPEDKEKKRINVVIIGHVDAGKSTLMGHLLYKLGNVSENTLRKFKKESVEIGKSSFHFAWVMDEHEEERQRGVTMDVGVRYFETPNRHVTILDAPGHKDFIPKMITGAAQADFAILVIDSTPGGFETGFANGGQTKEHLILARSLGVEQVIVVVNKLDSIGWSKERYDSIVAQLDDFMRQIGFQTQDGSHVFYIPASGLQGENLITKSGSISWYDGLSVVERIDKFEPKPRDIEKALRMSVSDVYKSLATGITVAGKIETGTISEGDELVIMPIREVCTVKSILRHKSPVKHGYAGDNVEIGLGSIDIEKLMVGQILCPIGNEIKVTNRFKARIATFDMKIPIIKGAHVVLHLHNIDVPAVITKLTCTLNKQLEILEKKPKCIPKYSNAIVTIVTDNTISIEKYADFAKFGRLTARVNGETVAAGVVEKVLSKK